MPIYRNILSLRFSDFGTNFVWVDMGVTRLYLSTKKAIIKGRSTVIRLCKEDEKEYLVVIDDSAVMHYTSNDFDRMICDENLMDAEYYVIEDINMLKTFGDPGTLSLWGALDAEHNMLAIEGKPVIVWACDKTSAQSEMYKQGVPASLLLYYMVTRINISHSNRRLCHMVSIPNNLLS